MVNGGSKWRSKKGKKTRKNVYSSRLADKKINTVVEKRIQEIARKEDQKNFVWYTNIDRIALPVFNWDAHGPQDRIPSNSMFGVNSGTLFHLRISDFGEKIKNSLVATAPVPEMNYIRCAAVKNRFEFRHSGSTPCRILIWILSVPGSNALSGATTMPDIKTAPLSLNGLYDFNKRIEGEDLPYKYRILGHKVVTLPPAKLFTAGVTRLDGGAPDVPTLHTEVGKVVYLNKYFNGQGKRFLCDDGTIRPFKEEMYIMMTADNPVDLTLVAYQKFRLEKPLLGAMPNT